MENLRKFRQDPRVLQYICRLKKRGRARTGDRRERIISEVGGPPANCGQEDKGKYILQKVRWSAMSNVARRSKTIQKTSLLEVVVLMDEIASL